VIVLAGLPGSGKSTYAAQLARTHGVRVLTADAIRLAGAAPARVFALMHAEASECLARDEDFIVDACNVFASQRRQWLSFGRVRGVRCELVIVDCAVDVALARDRARDVGVRAGDAVIMRMARQSRFLLRTVEREGWDSVRVYESVPLTSRVW
jgi:predicted kinase